MPRSGISIFRRLFYGWLDLPETVKGVDKNLFARDFNLHRGRMVKWRGDGSIGEISNWFSLGIDFNRETEILVVGRIRVFICEDSN